MEEKHHIHPDDCQCRNCQYQTPWISRVFDVLGVIKSSIEGGDGNIEYLAHFKKKG